MGRALNVLTIGSLFRGGRDSGYYTQAPHVSVSASSYGHTCAVLSNGSVKCWGDNSVGQLGTGSNTDSNAPVQVTGLTSGVSSVSAGHGHTCAVLSDGSVKCWGKDTGSNIPVQVTGLTSGVSSVSAGYGHTCAVLSDGSVKCWGDNNYGQLGTGSNTGSSIPIQVIYLTSGVSSVSAGYAHTCAVLSDGSVKCWGSNYHGALGTGSNTGSKVPVQVDLPYPPPPPQSPPPSPSPSPSPLPPGVSGVCGPYPDAIGMQGSCDITLAQGAFLRASTGPPTSGTCAFYQGPSACTGDTTLTLISDTGVALAYNDDMQTAAITASCPAATCSTCDATAISGACSAFQYGPAAYSGSYVLRTDCYTGSSCGATVAYSIIAPSPPPLSPSPSPRRPPPLAVSPSPLSPSPSPRRPPPSRRPSPPLRTLSPPPSRRPPPIAVSPSHLAVSPSPLAVSPHPPLLGEVLPPIHHSSSDVLAIDTKLGFVRLLLIILLLWILFGAPKIRTKWV